MHMSVAQAYAILEHSSVVELPGYIRRVPGSIPGVPIFQNGGIAMISEFVEYVKQVWKNKPNVSSPLNADRLNHMEAGIENNSKKIKETVTVVNELTEKCKNVDRCVRWVNNPWGTSLTIPRGETINGYVKISGQLVYLVWTGGDNLQYKKIYGTDEDAKTITFSYDKNTGLTVSTNSNQGILYIGM